MNEGIRFDDIRERLEYHSSESMNEFDFVSVFPEVAYHRRTHAKTAAHVGDWFRVQPDYICQASAYGDSPESMVLLLEFILRF